MAVVIAFGLLLCALLLYKPLQVRYHITKFNSPDIKVRVKGVDALLQLGAKGREALGRILPGGSEAAELLIKAWNNPDPALDTEADINSRDLASKPVSESALLQAARNEFAETVRLILAKHGHLTWDRSRDFNQRGIEYRKRGDNQTAWAYYNLAMIMDPKFHWPFNGLGNVKTDLEDYEGALQDYSKAIRLNPQYSIAYANRGKLKRLMGNLKEALEDCNKAVELDNSSDWARRKRIEVYADMLDIEGALPDFDKRAKDSPNSYLRRLELAYALYDSTRFKEAAAEFKKGIGLLGRHNNQSLYVFFRLCFINIRLGNASTVREEAKEYLEDFKSAGPWARTITRFFAGEISEADLLEAATRLKELSTPEQLCEAYYYVAETRLAAGDLEAAKKMFEKCIATKESRYTEYKSARYALKRLAARAKKSDK